MSDDPRIDKISAAFATLIVAIIDVAKGDSSDVPAEPQDTPRPTRKPRAQPAESPSAGQETATVVSEKPTVETSGAVVGDPEVWEKVKTLTVALSKSKGREAAADLMKAFGVERASALKPEQWPEFIEAAEAALEGDLV
jgi:hypothetical protein